MNNYHSPTVGAVLLNWNSYEAVAECLDELAELEFENLNIVVVDNGSTDDSSERLIREYSHVEFVEVGENLGFAAGHNYGIRELQKQGTDYMFILNNDIRIPDNQILKNAVNIMENNPSFGIVTPRIMEYPRIETVWFEQGRVNWDFGSYYHKQNHRWYIHGPDGGASKENSSTDLQVDDHSLIFNDYVPFTCALFRSNVFEEVGLLSEEYFLYAEDVDYCSRVKSAGYQIATVLDMEIYHEKNENSSLSPLRSYYGVRNRCLVVNKFDRTNSILFYLRYVFSVLVLIAHRLVYLNTTAAIAVTRGFIHGLLLRTGKGPYP